MLTKADTAVLHARKLAGARRLGLGCMGLTGIYGPVSREGAVDTLHAALDAGITLYDTAALYGSGANEELLGSVLGGRSEIVIVTKFGLHVGADGALVRDSSARTIRSSVEGSLRRLKRERIDLLLQHRPDPSVPDSAVAEITERLVAEGKIAAFGLSGTDPDRAGSWRHNPSVYAIQNELSLAAPIRGAEPRLMLMAGTVFMAFAPFGRGLLTRSASGVEGDIRSAMAGFGDVQSGLLIETIRTVCRIAKAHGASDARIALAWLLARSPNIVAIPGCRSRSQLDEIATGSIPTLSDGDLLQLEEACTGSYAARSAENIQTPYATR